MPRIVVVAQVAAPPERVFDCALDVGLHLASAAGTGERVVAGRTSGLFELGEEVTWEARHLGLRRRMTVRITGLERPRWFRDEMVRGPFASFVHDHHFEPADGGTRMRDELVFRAPLGPLGRFVGHAVLVPHLRRFLEERNRFLKEAAERADHGDG